METSTTAIVHDYLDQLRSLVEEHVVLPDGPLLLALAYTPSEPDVVALLEVLGNFGSNVIFETGEFFEVEFGAQATFPMEPGHRLRLVLCNTVEWRQARRDDWPPYRELLDAARAKRCVVLHSEGDGVDWAQELNALASE